MQFELVDLGILNSQYFQGFGGIVGAGMDAREAFDDALENMAQCPEFSSVDIDALEKQLLAQYPELDNPTTVEYHSVIEYLRRENPSEWFDDDGEFIGDNCELYYYIGIRTHE